MTNLREKGVEQCNQFKKIVHRQLIDGNDSLLNKILKENKNQLL